MSAMQEENTINWDFVVSIRRKPKNIHPSNLFHFLINIKREDWSLSQLFQGNRTETDICTLTFTI